MRDRIAGFALGVCALAGVVAVVHHPTVVSRAPAQALADIARLSGQDRLVHGTLIVVVSFVFYALCVFTLRRGARSGAYLGLVCGDRRAPGRCA